MRNVYILTAVILVFAAPNAWPATLILKSGTVINGDILEQDTKKVKLQVSGVPLTYYMDDISSIDGIDTSVINPNPAPPSETSINPVPAPGPAVNAPVLSVTPPPSAPVEGQPAPMNAADKRALILKFIDVFGTKESLNRNFAELIRRSSPEQAAQLKKVINVDDLIEQLIPLYDAHFTDKELTEYINFYSSPKGQKLLQTVPVLMEESVGISLKYFKEKLSNLTPDKTK